MASIKLTAAGQVGSGRGEASKAEERPMFHLTPYCGRVSGPNGFSFYKGEYHLFYQYNPNDLCRDFTHLGHAVSSTLFDWRHLPAEEMGAGMVADFGDYDHEDGVFTHSHDQPIDYGTDLYSPRTLLTPDGRRILIACMHDPEIVSLQGGQRSWAGQLTIPRELSVKDGWLCQSPAREIEQYYANVLTYKNVPVSDEVFLYGMEGSCVDIEINVRPVPGEPLYREFDVLLVMNEVDHSSISFSPKDGMVNIDRKHSGSREQNTHLCGCLVEESMDGNIIIRIILDRFSCEVFINDGRYVMSTVIPTGLSADKIVFRTEGKSAIDVTKRDIRI